MGINYNTFVGPYIEVYNPMKDTVEEYHTCPNKKCKNHGAYIGDGYCSKCGRSIERQTRPSKNKIEFDCYEELESNSLYEVLTEYKPDGKIDCQYFIDGSIGISMDGYHSNVSEISSESIVEQLDKINKKLKNDICKLQKVFGKDNVKIKWGVLTWCS